jgi:hypothetical protein
MLDLDHLDAHVGQMARAVRPGAVLLNGENAQTFEGQFHPVLSLRQVSVRPHRFLTWSLGQVQRIGALMARQTSERVLAAALAKTPEIRRGILKAILRGGVRGWELD